MTVEWILDKAVQVHGAGGLSQDFPLAHMSAGVRTLPLADGPDEVHKSALARNEIRRQAAVRAARWARIVEVGCRAARLGRGR